MPVVRILLIVFIFVAMGESRRCAAATASARVPSDFYALVAAIWMILAGVVTEGPEVGLKGAGANALEFTGAYYVYRHLLGAVNSSVNIVCFLSNTMIFVVCLALMDPLTGHLYVWDLVAKFTGYWRAFDPSSSAYVRDGLVRAQGPLEHSILFATACMWTGALALCTFKFSIYSVLISIIMAIGIWFSQSRAPLAAFMFGIGLIVFYYNTMSYEARWKILKALVATYIVAIFLFSNSPVTALIKYSGVDPEAGWYRQSHLAIGRLARIGFSHFRHRIARLALGKFRRSVWAERRRALASMRHDLRHSGIRADRPHAHQPGVAGPGRQVGRSHRRRATFVGGARHRDGAGGVSGVHRTLLGFLLDPHWGLCRNASQSGRGGDRAGTAAIVRDRRVRAGVT